MHSSSRLGINIPDGTDLESDWPVTSAQQIGVLDAAVLVTEGTLAARPAANTVEKDHIYKATDIGVWYVSDGTNWSLLATPQSGLLSARPAAGAFGRIYYATDTAAPSLDTGSAWLQLVGLGSGSLALRSTSGNVTANVGDLILAGGSGTISLPAASTTKANALIGVWNSGSSANTVSVSSGQIVGLGITGATSFQLNRFGSFALLQSDGSSLWYIIAGQQDTGWSSGKRILGDRSHGVTSVVIPSGSASASATAAHGLSGTPTQVVAGVQGTGGLAGFGVIAAPSGSNVSLQVFSTPLTAVGSNVTVAVGWTALL